MKTQNAVQFGWGSNEPHMDRADKIRIPRCFFRSPFKTTEFRWNGEKRPDDIPTELYDESDHKWTKGKLYFFRYVYGVKRPDGFYAYEVTFTAGPRARAWFEEQDKKYLRELLSNGKLKEVEPAVWYWWQKEGGEKIEIGDWWVRKWAECADKTGTEMAQKLARYEQEYKQSGERFPQEAKQQEQAAKQRAEQEAKFKAQQDATARAKKEQELAAQKAKAEAEAKKAQEIATQKEKAEQYEEEAEGAEAIELLPII